MPKEAEVLASVKARLKLWEFHKVVLWWERLQSLKIQHNGRWIQGCLPGTPDVVSIIRNKSGNITVAFFEVKGDSGTLRPEQKVFRNRFRAVSDVHYMIITHPNQVDEFISFIGIDRLSELPDSL